MELAKERKIIQSEIELPKTIVFLGASTCFGIGDPIGGGFAGRFKTWYENAAEEQEIYKVYNLGIPGDGINDMLDRISEVQKRKPGLVILHPGCNDIMREFGLQADFKTGYEIYSSSLDELLVEIQKLSNIIVISQLPIDQLRTTPVYWAEHYYQESDVIRLAKLTGSKCRELGISYIDLFSDWESKEYKLFLSEDGLHPNENGHEYIFQKIRDRFYKMYNIHI